MDAGEYRKALALASRFYYLGDHRNRIIDAHEAHTNPRFCVQMGKVPSEVIADGIDALHERYAQAMERRHKST
jgi:hypothetical protein